jgi:hypothetical protein
MRFVKNYRISIDAINQAGVVSLFVMAASFPYISKLYLEYISKLYLEKFKNP